MKLHQIALAVVIGSISLAAAPTSAKPPTPSVEAVTKAKQAWGSCVVTAAGKYDDRTSDVMTVAVIQSICRAVRACAASAGYSSSALGARI